MVSTRQHARKAAAALGLAAACICGTNNGGVDAFYTSSAGSGSRTSSSKPLGFATPPPGQPWLTRSLASHRPAGRSSRRYVRERSGLERGWGSVGAAADGDSGPTSAAGGRAWGSRQQRGRSSRSSRLSMVSSEDSGSATAEVSRCRTLWRLRVADGRCSVRGTAGVLVSTIRRTERRLM